MGDGFAELGEAVHPPARDDDPATLLGEASAIALPMPPVAPVTMETAASSFTLRPARWLR